MGKSRSSKKYANKYKCSYAGWWVLVILIIFHVLHKNMVLQMLPHSTGDQSKVICAKIFPQNLSQLMPAFINNFTQLLSLTLCPRQTISLVSVLLKEAVFRIGVYQFKFKKSIFACPTNLTLRLTFPIWSANQTGHLLMAARQQIDELRIWTPLPQGTTEDKSGVDKKLRDFATHTHRISKSRVVLFGLKFVLLNAHWYQKDVWKHPRPLK